MNSQFENEIRKVYPDGLTWQKTIPTFHPESTEEIADVFSRAGKCAQKLYISGFANNIDPVGQKFADILVIKTDRLNRIIDIGEHDFYITVGPGYPLKEINKVLADKSLWFPFGDTNYAGSFGGALVSGLAGSDGTHTVPLSRHLLSVTAVLPDCSIVKPGALTFKSVSGYDISRIFYNSWGTLGMVTELSFRILPLSKRAHSPHIAVFAPDMEVFKAELSGTTPLSGLCRKIKKDFDPDNLLPII
jgi:FAD/FMN-containing dehydrogenase